MLSVRGNHDDIVIDQYLNVIKVDPASLREKNEWIKQLTQQEVDFLIKLPYSISIPCLNSLVVHAGILPGVLLQDMHPRDLVSMRNVISKVDPVSGATILTATKEIDEGVPWAKTWKGPETVYFGHDARRKFQQEPFAVGLDTGCVYGRQLTGIFIHGKRKGLVIKVPSAKAYVSVEKD